MRILGLDFGSKTVGVAVSDGLLLTAQGVETIERKDAQDMRPDRGADRGVRDHGDRAGTSEKYEQYRRRARRKDESFRRNAGAPYRTSGALLG